MSICTIETAVSERSRNWLDLVNVHGCIAARPDGAADFQYPKRLVHRARGDVEAEAQAHAKGAFLGQIL